MKLPWDKSKEELKKLSPHEKFMLRLKYVNTYYQNLEFIVVGEYDSMKSKILVKNKYGYYLIQPTVLLKGFNVSIKSAVNKTYHWVERAKEIHGDRYDYSKVNYINDYTNLIVTCKEHGIFKQTPNSHLRGQGCPKCHFLYNNFRKKDWISKGKGKIGIFYIIECWNNFESFYKLGITYRTIEKRYRKQDKNIMPYKYEIIREIKSNNLEYIWDLEKRFKRFKQNNHYVPLLPFGGSVWECFK